MATALEVLEQELSQHLNGPEEPIKAPGPAKVSYSHEKMIDYIIATPRIKQGELAAIFGYTQAWVSQIMSSDAFKEKLAARRKEVSDPAVQAALEVWFPTTEESMRHLMDRSIEVLKEKLNQPKVPDALALRAFELGAKGLSVGGFGNKAPEPTDKPEADHLESLAGRLEGLLHTKRTELHITTEETTVAVSQEVSNGQA